MDLATGGIQEIVGQGLEKTWYARRSGYDHLDGHASARFRSPILQHVAQGDVTFSQGDVTFSSVGGLIEQTREISEEGIH